MKKALLIMLAVTLMLSMVSFGGAAAADSLKDTFVFAMGGQPEMLDPAVATDSVSQTAVQVMYFTLFRLDEGGATVPNAVEETDISEDGLTYTLKLVDGNKWSDGQPVLASEYAFGAKRALGMGSAIAYYSYFIKDYILNAGQYEGADVADMTDIGIAADDAANTLTFTLKKTTPYFLSLLTSTAFAAVRPDFANEHESTWAESADVPVNGAYYPVKIASNEEIVLKKNPYFIRANDVVTENLVLLTMEDMDAQMMAYQNGEIDMASSVDAGVVSSVFDGKPDLVKTNSVINYYVQMQSSDWSTAPALADYNVRRALQLALNREEIVTALDAGEAYYPLYGYVPKGMAGLTGDFREEVDNSAPYVYYDAEEAKELLAKAGYGPENPLNLAYKYNTNNMHDTVAQVMQQQWKQVGVNVTFEAMEVRSFFAERDEEGNYQLARGAMSADYMDPTTFLSMLTSSAQQKPVVTDEVYDGMIAQAEATMDPSERLEKLHQAEKYLVEEKAYTIPVFGYSSYYLVNPNASGIGFDPVGNMYLENVQVK